jgi:hypothetical protein
VLVGAIGKTKCHHGVKVFGRKAPAGAGFGAIRCLKLARDLFGVIAKTHRVFLSAESGPRPSQSRLSGLSGALYNFYLVQWQGRQGRWREALQ